MFYQVKPHAAHRNHPLAATERSHLLLINVICSERVPLRRCRGWWEWIARCLPPGEWWPWPVILIFKLVRARDQTLIGHKSVQRFPRYLIHKQANKK